MKIIYFILTGLVLFCRINALADEIHLKNKDKITGEIVQKDTASISIKTQAMGLVKINKDFIERIVAEDKSHVPTQKDPVKRKWKREIQAGYNLSTGNSPREQVSFSAKVNGQREKIDEITLRGNLYYSSTNDKMDSQRWYTMGRYAFSFGEKKKWYNFYRIEIDHDRFKNIDYRFVPAIGAGYWFFDSSEVKAMAELGLGFEYSDYRDQTKPSKDTVLIPRAFFEKKLFDNLIISENILLYPVLNDFSRFRVRSETVCSIVLTEKLSFRFSLIDDYNSNPPGDTDKNDLTFMSSIAYNF